MAKKQTTYTRLRNNYMARVRRLKKKGIILDEPIPETERQLRKKGITGRKLSAETRKMKKSLQNFESKKAVQQSSAAVGTVAELREKTRNAISPQKLAVNVLQDFLERISQPVYDPSWVKNKTYKKAIEETRRQQITLVSLIEEIINDPNYDNEDETPEEMIGRRLIESGGSYIDELIKGLFDSNAPVVQTAGMELARIIKGSELTLKEAVALTLDVHGNEIDYEARFVDK